MTVLQRSGEPLLQSVALGVPRLNGRRRGLTFLDRCGMPEVCGMRMVAA